MISQQEAYLQNVQATYRYFCYHAYNSGRDVEKSGYLWYPSKFHTFLCDTVQEFVERESDFPSGEFLILSCPPQHGKSTTVTETLAAWYKMKHPDKGVIVVAYGDTLSNRFGRANLAKIEQFSGIFGVKLNKKKANASDIELTGHKHPLIFRGYGSSLTGFTGNLIIIDDPIKNRQEADSETQRNKLWEEFNDSIKSRLNVGDKLILIMTRWHEDDLAARIMKAYPERTTVVNIPCEAEEDDVLGRKIGEPLCPEIGRDATWLADIKSTVTSEEGLRTWNALYQGRPSAREGNMLKREWWKYYKYEDYLDRKIKIKTMIMSVDAAFKDQKNNDYVAIQVWGKTDNRYYLIDARKKHLDFPETVKEILRVKALYRKITQILIEDKANGSGIIQTLRDKLSGIIGITPVGSKESRVSEVSYIIESGCVYLPEDKHFTLDFVDECASFPNAKHDDQVDAMSQALKKLFRVNVSRRVKETLDFTGDIFGERKNKSKQSAIGKGDKIHVI